MVYEPSPLIIFSACLLQFTLFSDCCSINEMCFTSFESSELQLRAYSAIINIQDSYTVPWTVTRICASPTRSYVSLVALFGGGGFETTDFCTVTCTDSHGWQPQTIGLNSYTANSSHLTNLFLHENRPWIITLVPTE
jgi:hypothetical protein